MRFSRVFVTLGIAASSAACSLFVSLDGLNDGGASDDGSIATDGSSSDAVHSSDATPRDDGSSVVDSGAPFDCKSIDATFCDDFDRDAALGSTVWSGEQTDPGCSLSVNGTLVTNAVATAGRLNCYLTSTHAPENRHLTLDFDVTFSLGDASDSPGISIAEIDNNLGSPNAAGVQAQAFQILALGTGNTKIGFIEYFPDAAASPDRGNSFPYWGITGNELPFITPGVPCHITLVVDTVATNATATATCQGHSPNVLPSISVGQPAGFLGTPVILFGYDNILVDSPAWFLAYDNMVFRSTP